MSSLRSLPAQVGWGTQRVTIRPVYNLRNGNRYGLRYRYPERQNNVEQ